MIVPDGIEPVVGYREWYLNDGLLCSINGGGFDGQGPSWTPGEPMHATCALGPKFEWSMEEGGLTLTQVQEILAASNVQAAASYSVSGRAAATTLPNVLVPEGWGYAVRKIEHEAPYESCSCGIYAKSEPYKPERCAQYVTLLYGGATPPFYGDTIYGSAYLWGKVIPGSSGYRAEYAYPKELTVKDAATAERLREKYGVEVVVPKPKEKHEPPANSPVKVGKRPRFRILSPKAENA